MFRSPIAIDRKQLRAIDTPEDFRDAIAAPKIDVLPLVTKPASAKAGWCTYVYEFPEAPELEVLSGGVNHKSPRAGMSGARETCCILDSLPRLKR